MTAPRVAVPGEGIVESLRNALQIIVGAKSNYALHQEFTSAQELYADLMAVEYRIQQALQQMEHGER